MKLDIFSRYAKRGLTSIISVIVLTGLLYITGCGDGTAGTTNQVPPLQSQPTKVSGKVYFRDSKNSYPGEISAGDAVDGVVLKGGAASINSNTTGDYSFATFTPGFQTITADKKGYISTSLSWTFQPGESYIFNIGLYKEPETVKPAAKNFIKGIITWDGGEWINDYFYPKKLFQATFSRIKDKTGANLVSFPDPVFIKNVSKNSVTMGTESNSGSSWHVLSESDYSTLVNDAHNKDLKFLMWLGVIDDGKIQSADNSVYRDLITKGHLSNDFWTSWFSEYKKYVKTYATIARKLKIDGLVLGDELGYATNKNNFTATPPDDCLSHWRDLINTIRDEDNGAGYKGELIYFGSAVPHGESPYYEDASYPDGFIELFDKIGITIRDIHDDYSPNVNELKDSFSTLLARYSGVKKPLLILVQTPSIDGGASISTFIDPMLSRNKNANSRQRNFFLQADIYEALFEALNAMDSNQNIAGVFSGGYHYLDDFLVIPGKDQNQMLSMDKSASVRGKPAETVLKYWYGKL